MKSKEKLTTGGYSFKTNQSPYEALNINNLSMLPPEVEGPTFGNLILEMGNLESLIYDG
jgi:hypothetical protein